MSDNIIKTNYKAGKNNVRPLGLEMHDPVFFISAAAIVAFTLFALVFQNEAEIFFGWLRSAITSSFDWFFLSAGNVFVIFAAVLVCSPLGKVRLGGKDAKPDFSYRGWIAMLFTAGMGIGLMFFGVAEPISHFDAALQGAESSGGVGSNAAPLGIAASDTDTARNLAMAATIFHWGLHPWAIYAVVGLALAFFAYNQGLPLTMRSAFYPILGERIWGRWGHAVDVLAVFATLFGLATSLGFGATQVLAGFNFLYGWGTGEVAIIMLISVVTMAAITSVILGLSGGIKVLSEINVVMASLLLLFVIAFGPTVEIIKTGVMGTTEYLKQLVPLSMPFGREDNGFLQDWTAFYWAWWISWSPFVGMFIARISRGRTVREFMVCVILLPSVLCTLWMSAFGGTAISQVVSGTAGAVLDATLELKLFEMVGTLPLSGILSLIGIVLVLVFFVTSSDSGSLVIDTITAGGKTDAPVGQRVFWCSFEGVVAAVLLLVGGSGAVGALQAMTVSTGLPFSVVLLAMCVSTYIGLKKAAKDL